MNKSPPILMNATASRSRRARVYPNFCLIVHNIQAAPRYWLTIVAKAVATVFLLVYFVFMEPIWVVLASGIGDGLMCLLVLWALGQSRKAATVAMVPPTARL